jgi:hypothetical protein
LGLLPVSASAFEDPERNSSDRNLPLHSSPGFCSGNPFFKKWRTVKKEIFSRGGAENAEKGTFFALSAPPRETGFFLETVSS